MVFIALGLVVLAVAVVGSSLHFSQAACGRAAEEFLELVYTAAPEDLTEERLTEEGMAALFRERVTEKMWENGLANRVFGRYVAEAAGENCTLRPAEIALEELEGEKDRVTYSYTVQVKLTWADPPADDLREQTGTLVMVRREGRWLADHYRWERPLLVARE